MRTTYSNIASVKKMFLFLLMISAIITKSHCLDFDKDFIECDVTLYDIEQALYVEDRKRFAPTEQPPIEDKKPVSEHSCSLEEFEKDSRRSKLDYYQSSIKRINEVSGRIVEDIISLTADTLHAVNELDAALCLGAADKKSKDAGVNDYKGQYYYDRSEALFNLFSDKMLEATALGISPNRVERLLALSMRMRDIFCRLFTLSQDDSFTNKSFDADCEDLLTVNECVDSTLWVSDTMHNEVACFWNKEFEYTLSDIIAEREDLVNQYLDFLAHDKRNEAMLQYTERLMTPEMIDQALVSLKNNFSKSNRNMIDTATYSRTQRSKWDYNLYDFIYNDQIPFIIHDNLPNLDLNEYGSLRLSSAGLKTVIKKMDEIEKNVQHATATHRTAINVLMIKYEAQLKKRDKVEALDTLVDKRNIFRSIRSISHCIEKKTAIAKEIKQLSDDMYTIGIDLTDFLNNYPTNNNPNGKQFNEENEEHYFTPKKPIPLTEEQKKKDVSQRIAQKYIGKIPTQIQDVIFYFTHHNECTKNNVSIHNRLLLHGKPGTGKSYLVKVLAQELELPLLSFAASFFTDKYIGETSRRIRKAFNNAVAHNKPLLIFIDEIDGIATKRNDSMHAEHRAALVTLLAELQDLAQNKNIFIFAATNDLKSLDPAVQDRFAGGLCEIKELSLKERAQLFKKVFADKQVKISASLAQRLAEVSRPTLLSTTDKSGFSNRDIEYIVTTALLKYYADYTKNPEMCKHICSYIRAVMNTTKKKGRFAWFFSIYCDGI